MPPRSERDWPAILQDAPYKALAAELARRNADRRVTKTGGRNGGRPAVLVECPKCGEAVTKTQLRRGHKCTLDGLVSKITPQNRHGESR